MNTRIVSSRLDRRQLFLLTFSIIIANCLYARVSESIETAGLVGALFASFNVSAIVWIAVWISLEALATDPSSEPYRSPDFFFASAALFASVLPIGGVTWIFLTGLSVYVIITSARSTRLHRSAWIMLAITFPMFWGKRVFNLFSDYILAVDATLVSLITHTPRTGNIVAFPDGSGSLLIGAACSSMANVSLAVLCWTSFTQYFNVKWRYENIIWCLLAAASVMAVNIARISLIGFFPPYYKFLHDGGGVEIFSWLSALVCGAVSYIGVRYGRAKEI